MKKRYNAFNQIHKGLRAMMYDTAMALQHSDYINSEETEKALEKVEIVLAVFEDHASHEDNYVLPAVTKYFKHLAVEFESEHETDEMLAHRLRNLMVVYSYAVSGDARQEAGEAIYKAFNEFIAFNLYHMNKEEDKLNKAMWEKYTDEEILDIQKTIVQNVSEHMRVIENTWMMRGINDPEIVKWLTGVKNSAPDFIFQGLLKLAEKELSLKRWMNVKDALTEGAMVA